MDYLAYFLSQNIHRRSSQDLLTYSDLVPDDMCMTRVHQLVGKTKVVVVRDYEKEKRHTTPIPWAALDRDPCTHELMLSSTECWTNLCASTLGNP